MEIHLKSNTASISSELESYATMKLKRLSRYMDKIQSVTANFVSANSKRKESAFRCEVHLVAPGQELHANSESNSFRTALDTCAESLKTQLARFVEKRSTRQRDDAGAAKIKRATAVRTRPAVPWDTSEHRYSVEHYSVKPRDVQDAISELKEGGSPVVVFINASGQVNAVMKRGRRIVVIEPDPSK